MCKECQDNSIVWSLLQIIRFHKLRKNEANVICIWFSQRNYYRYNYAFQKHKSNNSHKWEGHRLLRRCRWSLTKTYISTIFVYNLTRLCTTNINRSYKRRWFHILKKANNRLYPRRNYYRCWLLRRTSLLVNTPTQAKSLQHKLEKAAGSIGLDVNYTKTEYMCLKLTISILSGKNLKLAG